MEDRRLARTRLWFLRIWAGVGLAVLAWILYRVLREPLAIIVAPLLLAGAILYVLNPVVGFLQKRGVPRLAGTALAYLVFIGVITLLVVYLGPEFADQVEDLVSQTPEILADLRASINAQLRSLGVGAQIPPLEPGSDQVQDFLRRLFSGDSSRLFALLAGAGEVVGQVFHVLVTIILGPVLAFYLLVDLPRLAENARRLIPPGNREEVGQVISRIIGTVGAYFRGMLLVAAFVAIATGIGLAIIGLPFWVLVGIVAGVTNLVPLIGPFVGAAVGIVVALTVGEGTGQAVAVGVVMLIVQQVDNHILSPNIMSRTVQLHPVTVMLGLLVAGSMFGIFGMFVVVPLIATAKLVFVHLFTTRVGYAAQEVAHDEEQEIVAAVAAELTDDAAAVAQAGADVADSAARVAEAAEGVAEAAAGQREGDSGA